MTAVMLVIAPPMPMRWPGGGSPSRRENSAGDRGERVVELLPRDGPVEPMLGREPHSADVQAVLLLDGAVTAVRELGAAAAGVEHDHPALAEAQAGLGRQVGEPAFLRAGEHLDGDPTPFAHVRHDESLFLAVRTPHGADRDEPGDVVLSGLLDHAADSVCGARDGLRGDLTRLGDALAETAHLRPVDERAPCAVVVPLADVELDRVGAHVDDRERRHVTTSDLHAGPAALSHLG